jgi:hypothetical protein
MNILLLNASPKRITSASKYFLGLLGLHTRGCKTTKLHLSGSAMYEEVFRCFEDIDALVIALPVYVDGVPGSVLRFLEEAEQYIKENNCSFKLYVISNCGFYEGRQCKHLLNIMHNFCSAAGLSWGGGIGIGAGEMLSVIRIMPVFAFAALIFSVPPLLLTDVSFLSTGITAAVIIFVFLLLSSRLFFSIRKLGKAVRQSKIIPDFYTGLTLCPRILFLLFANLYFIVRASLCGRGFWEMYKKD